MKAVLIIFAFSTLLTSANADIIYALGTSNTNCKNAGSTQLTGDGHLLNTVEYSIPTTVCQDAQSVILEISKSIRSSRHHLHFSVEPFGDAV